MTLQTNAMRDWVVELRSGNHEQGIGRLVSVNPDTKEKAYCCIGVLADVLPGLTLIDSHYMGVEDGATYSTSLDDGVMSAAMGFGPEGEWARDFQTRLIQLNDDKHASFDEIADWIEEFFDAEDDTERRALFGD